MTEQQLDANTVINSLLGQIATLSQEKAMLQVQLEAALKPKSEPKEDENDDTV